MNYYYYDSLTEELYIFRRKKKLYNYEQIDELSRKVAKFMLKLNPNINVWYFSRNDTYESANRLLGRPWNI